MRDLNVLILEDDPHHSRMRAFRDRFAETWDTGQAHVIYFHVEHAADCIALLSSENRFDIVFLDHDLNGQEMVGADDPDCGSRVAEFLAANPAIRARHGKIVIHSSNWIAGPAMVDMIPDSEWEPGIYLKEVWAKWFKVLAV